MLNYISTAWVCGQFISQPTAITIAPLLPCGLQMTIFCMHYGRGDFKGFERVLYIEGLTVMYKSNSSLGQRQCDQVKNWMALCFTQHLRNVLETELEMSGCTFSSTKQLR